MVKKKNKKKNLTVETLCDLHSHVLGYLMASSDVHSYEEDLKHLKAEVDAGADLIITQMFFEVKTFLKFVDDCQRYGINVPIIPALFPIQVCNKLYC